MQALKYRNATQADLPKIVEIYNSTVASRIVTADTEPVSVSSKQQWFDQHNAEKHPLWIVENAEPDIIAWISFQPFHTRPAYNATAEISIYIDEASRGQGMGTQILQHSIDRAPSLGIKTIISLIFEHNEPSLKLFHRFGFETWGMLPNIAILDETEEGLKILGKRVG